MDAAFHYVLQNMQTATFMHHLIYLAAIFLASNIEEVVTKLFFPDMVTAMKTFASHDQKPKTTLLVQI